MFVCHFCSGFHSSIEEVRNCTPPEMADPLAEPITADGWFCSACQETMLLRTDCEACGAEYVHPRLHGYWCAECQRCSSAAHEVHCAHCGLPEIHPPRAYHCRECGCADELCVHLDLRVFYTRKQAAFEELGARIAAGDPIALGCLLCDQALAWTPNRPGPGWYDDPESPHHLRRWTGLQWTRDRVRRR